MTMRFFVKTVSSVLAMSLAGTIFSLAAEGALRDRVKNAAKYERAHIALSITGIDDPDDLSLLEELLDDEEEVVRTAAASALVRLGQWHIFRKRLREAPLHRSRLEALVALRSTLAGMRDRGLRDEALRLRKESVSLLNPPLKEPAEDDPIQDGRFDKGGWERDWKLISGGGEVTLVGEGRSGKGALQITHSSPRGVVELKSRRPLKVPRGRRTPVRFYYRSDNAPNAAMLQLLFEDRKTKRRYHAPKELASITAESQSVIINTPRGIWNKRVTEAPRAPVDREYDLILRIWGNPATVLIDDFSAPAANYAYQWPAGTMVKEERWAKAPETRRHDAKVLKVGESVRLQMNGKAVPPVLYLTQRSNMGDYAGVEQIGGVRMMVVSVPISDIHDPRFEQREPIWQGERSFNFSEALKDIDLAANNARESAIILNLCFYWPREWAERNPAELWRNAAGEAGYGTQLRFMGFGKELPKGGNYRWWPSPSSVKALEDAAVGVRALMKALKNKPYFERIVGCHISGGHDMQFFTGNWPDYSEPAVRAFRAWLKNRYRTVEELRRAWGRPDAEFETAAVPDYAALRARPDGQFLDPTKDGLYADHQEFQAEQGMLIRQYLAASFKNAMGREGIAMTWQIGGGRGQGADQVFLREGEIDMMVTQPSYSIRNPAQVGGVRGMLTSMSVHGKLAIKELDLRTWLRPGGHEVNAMRLVAAWTPEMFRSVLRREAAQMMAAGHGFWLYDIVPVHFRDPEIYEEVKQVVKGYQKMILDADDEVYRPDVIQVWTDTSKYWLSDATFRVPMAERLEFYTMPELKAAGVPYDTAFLSDLPDLQRRHHYKVVIICDAWRLTESQREGLKELLQKQNTTVIWNYAAGYLSDEGLSTQKAEELTGIKVVARPTARFLPAYYLPNGDPLTAGLVGVAGTGQMAMGIHALREGNSGLGRGFVRFEIDDDEAVPLAAFENGGTAIAVKRLGAWTSLYLGMPGLLDGRLLNRVAREAGAHVLVNPGVAAVEYNGTFLSVHALRNGPVHVRLERKARVRDFDNDETIADGEKDFSIPMSAGETRWFRVESVTGTSGEAGVPKP